MVQESDYYVIKEGDTIESIAKQFDVPSEALYESNKDVIGNSDTELIPGEILILDEVKEKYNPNIDYKPVIWERFPNFNKKDFVCSCGCGKENVQYGLIEQLDGIEKHFGGKIHITSGVRCQKKNDSLTGSSPKSRHIYGKAADIYVEGVSQSQLQSYTYELMRNGDLNYTYSNGTYMNGVVHVDIK